MTMAPTISKNYLEAGAQISRDDDKWGNDVVGTSAEISYGFRDSTSEAATFSELQRASVVAAMSLWSDLADIRFRPTSASNADLTFGGENDSDPIAGRAYGPDDLLSAGEVYINQLKKDANGNSVNANMTFDLGTDRYRTIIHETGHALGLQHPGPYNGSAIYAKDAVYFQDTAQYSIMSYFGKTEIVKVDGVNVNVGAGPIERGDIGTPMLHDIAAIQRLYGANMNTRTGDDVYGFNSNTGRAGLTLTSSTELRAFAIWDAGGAHDKLDFSGFDTTML
jgi:serralysin